MNTTFQQRARQAIAGLLDAATEAGIGLGKAEENLNIPKPSGRTSGRNEVTGEAGPPVIVGAAAVSHLAASHGVESTPDEGAADHLKAHREGTFSPPNGYHEHALPKSSPLVKSADPAWRIAQKLDDLAAAEAKRAGVTKSEAYDRVLATPEGSRLRSAYEGRSA